MKIMLVTRVWPTQRPGGMAHVCEDRAAELARQGHEVHVVTTALSPIAGATGPAGKVEEGGVTVRYAPVRAHEWSKAFGLECLRYAERLRPEIVHSESFDRERPWWTGLQGRGSTRVAVSLHGFGMGAWLTRWNLYRALGRDPGQPDLAGMRAERDALATADVVIGTSRWEWRLLRDQYGLPRARLVYDPIHPCFFDAPYVPAPRERFLCVAISQGHTRGFRIASEAARRAGVRMVAVDSKPRTEMPAVYDSALALVLPTAFAQGFDLTIAEGRARGVPAIMTPTGSYLDEAEPWDRLVELGDVEGLAEVLKIKWPAAPHEGAADRHRPEAHVKSWLGTIA